jgi:hypothetical protein
MQLSLTFLLAMSCGLPAIVGLFQYRQAEDNIKPFIYIVWLAFLTELIAKFGVTLFAPKLTGAVYNLYIPLNFSFYLLFFYKNKIINKQKMQLFLAASLLVWVGCIAYKHSLQIVAMYAQMFNAIIIVLLAIELLTKQVFQFRQPLHKNLFFWFVCGCVLQSLFFILIATLLLLGTDYDALRTKMYFIYGFANALTYLIFMIALFCQKSVRNTVSSISIS